MSLETKIDEDEDGNIGCCYFSRRVAAQTTVFFSLLLVFQ